MPAEHEQSVWARAWGRRRKATEERTRGMATRGGPSMGIWSLGGAGERSFCTDWWELESADDGGSGCAGVAEGLVRDW